MKSCLRIAIATVVTLGVCAPLSAQQADCLTTTIDFEDIPTTTPVFGLNTISPLLSISGDVPMEVLQEDLTDPSNPSILAYNSNVYGNNAAGGENYLPGDNAKSFGNASTERGATSQDLRIDFNPDIGVASFAIDISDFGDWFPIGGADPRVVTLSAFDSGDALLIEDELSLNGPSPNHDVFVAGLRNLAVTVNDAEIAYVTLDFEDVDPGVSFDNIEICVLPDKRSLCAGQHMDIGEISVTNDADSFYVSFEVLEPGWYLTETHVAVGDIPTNKKGNPVPGQFPYACELDGSLEAYCVVEIPRGDLDGDVDIAAHAAVFQLAGDGCGEDTQYANEVILNNQGTLKGGGTVLANRSDPEAVFAPGGEFFSLGFGGDLTVGFGYPVYNGPGNDVCVQEITNGRPTYPEELVELYDGADTLLAAVSNRVNGTGYACVDLPGSVQTSDFVKLVDITDPTPHSLTADAYDVDFVAACYLYLGEETAWGAACYEDEGTRFVEKGNWGTFFSYTIH